ncbi:hypothetical protein BDN71DRAFT_1449845 [Pleurotus eryngii]|uniref:Uncharacterized protein n=1 Tax=Pleurotus eryngii TaxID=5323 RepID=A0A9P5ZW53_PLEER|nr:hypothetical protein BDN71DRAFT_1449845 [Pleurotus eryngii]
MHHELTPPFGLGCDATGSTRWRAADGSRTVWHESIQVEPYQCANIGADKHGMVAWAYVG